MGGTVLLDGLRVTDGWCVRARVYELMAGWMDESRMSGQVQGLFGKSPT